MAIFFVTPEELTGNRIDLTGENAQHAKVLRLKVGEEVLVCDGRGQECRCAVESVSGGLVELTVLERLNQRIVPQMNYFIKGSHIDQWEYFPGSSTVTYF